MLSKKSLKIIKCRVTPRAAARSGNAAVRSQARTKKKGVIFMAGYFEYSKSNNALDAEYKNKFPASIAAKKLGVSTKAIKELLSTDEWHHTSNYYNKTDYYDIDIFLKIKAGEDISEFCSDDEEKKDYLETWEKLKKFKEKIVEEKYRANVTYLIWTGSRNYPKAKEFKFDNIEVLEKGSFYIFLTPNGQVKKKIGSNGTRVEKLKEVIK